MEKFYTAQNLQEAYLLKGLLQQAGIETRIFNEHAQGALGEIPFAQTWPEIWLEDSRDLPLARQLVERYETNTSPNSPHQRCHQCGESNPAGFELCWNCGHSLEKTD